MFDNLKIGKKLLLLSGVILLLLVATVIWSALGLSTTVDKGSQAAQGNKLRSELLALEIKHDAWNFKLNQFLTNPKIKELKVKFDPQTCALGKWYYSEERKKAEQLLPAIKEDLAAIEEPHRKMHLSGGKIKEVYRDADPELPGQLAAMEKDHIVWVSSVQNSILSGHEQINVQKDHTKCAFGQFLASPEAAEAAQKSPVFAKFLNDAKEPHEQLHRLAIGMEEALASANRKALHELYDEVIPTLAKVRYSLNGMQKEAEKLLEGQKKALGIYRDETLPSLKKLKQHIGNIMEISKESLISDQEMIISATGTRNAIIVLGVIALLIGIALAYIISRSLTAPMKQAMAMLGDLDAGHLDTRLNMKRKDEIGQMATTMDNFAESLQNEVVSSLQRLANGDLTFDISPRDNQDQVRGSLQKLGIDLNQIMQQIQAASEQIASGSSQVSESAQGLSDGAAQSAASVEEISSSMNEIGSQTSTSAEYAQEANQLAASARVSADNGSERMTEMISAMDEINEAGQNISKIIKVIDEIAFQTNLLALNAAVEAARAGQHGKGFAVVAEEVRNLAARSAKAASETAELIEGSVAKANNGTQIAKRTAAALDEIVASIGKVTDLVGEIAASSNEQAQGIAQVNIGMQQIDQVIQQNTANAEESAATSEELSSQAAELKQQLSRFKLKGAFGQSYDPAPAQQLSLPRQSQNPSGWVDIEMLQQQNTAPMLQWKEEFNTGVALMDQQHRRLVDLINQLFQCMKDGGDRMLLANVVDELVNYTVTHFRAEEDVMKKHNYPDIEAHKLVHKNFIEQVAVYAEKLKAGDRLPPAEVYKFLKDWLISHIEHQDRDGYGRYIGSKA
ncbi:MAG: bacteriohemerythrin [Deltaproteobacteria bacterium]|nr:bacteriohemerythrin [Deltaproteobacteria bacterium]